MADTKQITVTLELTERQQQYMRQSRYFVPALTPEQAKSMWEQFRSALKAEQKPVEPKEIILGPDTPLGWYKVIDCKEKHHGNGACELRGEPLQLYKVDKSGGWFYRGGLVDIGATLQPVPAPVAAEGEDVNPNFNPCKDGGLEYRMNDEWRYIPPYVVEHIRSEGRSDLQREYEASKTPMVSHPISWKDLAIKFLSDSNEYKKELEEVNGYYAKLKHAFLEMYREFHKNDPSPEPISEQREYEAKFKEVKV